MRHNPLTKYLLSSVARAADDATAAPAATPALAAPAPGPTEAATPAAGPSSSNSSVAPGASSTTDGSSSSTSTSPAGSEAAPSAAKPEASLLSAAEAPKKTDAAAPAPATTDAKAPKDGDGKETPPPKADAKEAPAAPKDAKDATKDASKDGKPAADAAADKPGEKPEEAKKDGPAEKPAPKVYEPFKVPDGVKLDDAQVKTFTGILDNPEMDHQARGQALMDLHVTETKRIGDQLAKHQRDVFRQMTNTMKDQIRSDPVVGGSRQDTALGLAKGVIEEFGGPEYGGSPELVAQTLERLDYTSMGNDVGLVRVLHTIAGLLAEGTLVLSTPPSARTPRSRAETWYDQPKGGNGAG